MAVTERTDWFPRIWETWKTLLGAVATVLAVGGGISLAEWVLTATNANATLGTVGWIVFFATVWPGLGIGGTYLYLRAADLGAQFRVGRPQDEAKRLIGALILLVVGVFAAGAFTVWAGVLPERSFMFVTAFVGPTPGASLENWTLFLLETLFTVTLLGVFVGPAVAAQVHGVLQTTIREVATPGSGIVGAALCMAVVLGVGNSGVSLGAFLLAAVIVAGTGYVYERTENLLAPMVAYGLAAVFGAILVLLPTAMSFYSTFGTALP